MSTSNEFESNEEAQAFYKFRDATPTGLSPYELMATSWRAAREFFTRPTEDARRWLPRGDVATQPTHIGEAFQAYEQAVIDEGIIQTRMSTFGAGYRAGQKRPLAANVGLATNRWLFDELLARLFAGHTHGDYSTVTESNSLSPVGGRDEPAWFLKQAKKIVESIEGTPEDKPQTGIDYATVIETAKQTGTPAMVDGVKISPCDAHGRTEEERNSEENLRMLALQLASGIVAKGVIPVNDNGTAVQYHNPVSLAEGMLTFLKGGK